MSYNTGLWGESRTGIGAFNFDNPVSANFSAVPLAGVAPLTVNFTDLSTGSGINSWIWDFGDGHISATQNPVHIYSSFGNKTVTLSASNLTNSDINIKSNYIFVAMPTIVANFSGTPLIAYPGETIHFTDTTTGSIPTNWNWNFGDGGTSNLQNPTHIYTSGGRNYDVYLQAFNGYTGDQITKNNYIQILPNVNTNFTATPITGFSPLTVNFTDLTTGTLPFIWQWDFGDGYGSSTQNPIHIYSAGGLYTVELNDSNGIISGSNVKSNYINVSMPVNQTVNVNAPINVFYQLLQPTIYSFQKDVNFVGVPLVGTSPLVVDFTVINNTDVNNYTYNWYFDYDNDITISATTKEPIISHIYNGYKGQKFSVGFEAINPIISAASYSQLKQNYITLCGPEILGRYGSSRDLNLTDFLPSILKGGETQELVGFFQDFLNNLYTGIDGWNVSSTNLLISANPTSASINSSYLLSGNSYPTDADNAQLLDINWPDNANSINPTISILEKVNRLTELHDPDLIDIEYIQFFAKNLGYNLNVYRNEMGIGGVGSDSFFGIATSGICSQSDINKYLRFVVSNLPNFYKIKTTRNSIKVMLYSFGLVGDIVNYFTTNYLPSTVDGSKWIIDVNGNLDVVNDNYFPTPHFAVVIDIDNSADISFDSARSQSTLRAIEAVRPVNTVFRGLVGEVTRYANIYIDMIAQNSRVVDIGADGFPCDFWKT